MGKQKKKKKMELPALTERTLLQSWFSWFSYFIHYWSKSIRFMISPRSTRLLCTIPLHLPPPPQKKKNAHTHKTFKIIVRKLLQLNLFRPFYLGSMFFVGPSEVVAEAQILVMSCWLVLHSQCRGSQARCGGTVERGRPDLRQFLQEKRDSLERWPRSGAEIQR